MTPEHTIDTGLLSRRRIRSDAVLKGAGFGIFARVVSVSSTMIQVPIALKYLGVEGFGLWMTLSSIAGLSTVADFGFGLGAKTLFAQAFGRQDIAGLSGLLRESLRIMLVLGSCLAAIGLVLAWTLDWRALLGVSSSELAHQLPWALSYLSLCVGFSLPLSIGGSLAAATQYTWIQNALSALGGLLTLLIVVLVVFIHGSWLSLVVAILFLPLIMNGVLLWWIQGKLNGWAHTQRHIDARQISELRTLSLWFFVPQAGSLFATLSIPVLISTSVGPAAVTAFNLLQRIFGLVAQSQWMALSALWPAYSEAMVRGDHSWMRRAYLRSWQATLALFIPSLLIVATLTPWLVRYWVGQQPATLTPELLWLSAVLFALQLCGQPPALIMNGLGRVRGPAIYGTVGHLLSLIGMLIGGKLAGAPGVVAGMISGYLLIGLPGILIQTSRTITNLPT